MCPGKIATLSSLHVSNGNDSEGTMAAEKLLESLGGSSRAKLAMAEFKVERGLYDNAVELLQGIVQTTPKTKQ